MDTFIETSPGVRINANYAQDAIKRAAEQGVYKYVDEKGAPRSPLGSLSTDGAAETLRQKADKLNAYSPTPTVTEEKKVTDGTQPPKAYFVNESGQEAEYTQEQLNDPSTRDFLSKGGYAMSKTEGPTALAGEVSELDNQITGLINSFNSYNVESDPNFAPQANAIKGQYNELREEVRQAEEIYKRSIGTSMQRYTPNAAAGLEFMIATEATKALGSILRKEQSAIAEARSAYQDGKFTQFNNIMNQLEKIRSNKASQLEKINASLEKGLDEQRKDTKRMQMEEEIGGLLSDGITDPLDIAETLGYKYASKDISDALKNLVVEKDDWKEKLSGSTRDFYILKGQNQLPGNIASLPENQQLLAYLKQEKAASTVGESGNKITLSEARTNGLPIAVVGLNEKDIIASLQSGTAPAWFVEKTKTEIPGPYVLTTQEMKALWDEYRKEWQAQFEEEDDEGVDNPYK